MEASWEVLTRPSGLGRELDFQPQVSYPWTNQTTNLHNERFDRTSKVKKGSRNDGQSTDEEVQRIAKDALDEEAKTDKDSHVPDNQMVDLERPLQERLSDFTFGCGVRRSSPAYLVHRHQSPDFGWKQPEEVDEAIQAEENQPQISTDACGHERLDEGDSEHCDQPNDRAPIITTPGVEEEV